MTLQESRTIPGAGLVLKLGDEVGVSLAPFGLALGFDLEGALRNAARIFGIVDSTRCLGEVIRRVTPGCLPEFLGP
jgi:hypothetical protein